MAVIYLFGDSITYGAWDIKKSGWASLLRRHFDEIQEKDDSLYYLVYNLGIPGDTTDGLLKRFAVEVEARSFDKGEMKAIFIFAFGSNDSVHILEKQDFRVPQERFISNYQKVIDSAKKVSKDVIMVNIFPVNEAACEERYKGKGKTRLNKYIGEYNKLIDGLAQRNSLPVVDVNSGSGPEHFSEDGLHPSEAGHKAIFEKVITLL